MDAAASTLAATRIRRFLESEPVVWVSTVRPDGTPHLVPIWFWWDGEALLVFSKPEAQKVRNLRANPSVMLALGDAEDDFDVGLIEATAVLADEPTPLTLPAAFREKYAGRIGELGLTPAQFARTYPQVIRLTPIKKLGWHGRSTPASVVQAAGVVASQRITSIAEPIRVAVRGLFGEPMGRGVPAI
jgi:PPOX class probable F420-dependent enzyme